MANGEQKNPQLSSQRSTRNPILRITLYAQLSTLNAQLTTRNLFSLSRPNLFVADATPTSIISVLQEPLKGRISSAEKFRQNEITHYALRITHHAFTHHAQPSTRNAQPLTSGLAPLLPATRNTQPATQFYALRITDYALRLFLVPRPSPLVPFRYVVMFVTVKSKMAKMAGK